MGSAGAIAVRQAVGANAGGETMSVQSIGMPVRREEDFRLLRGRGRYVDDLKAASEARGYVLRSPHAHARIAALDNQARRRKSADRLRVMTDFKFSGKRS